MTVINEKLAAFTEEFAALCEKYEADLGITMQEYCRPLTFDLDIEIDGKQFYVDDCTNDSILSILQSGNLREL